VSWGKLGVRMEKERLNETDRIKEVVRFLTEWLKIFAMLLAVCVGGSISLIVDGLDKGRQVILCTFGLLIGVFMFFLGFWVTNKVRKLLK
jgi:hypothetical protein